MTISPRTENHRTAHTPFSLQHWSVLSAVKDAIRRSAPLMYRGCVLLDIDLFEVLKDLHRRGVRVLDYEFTITATEMYKLRVPLRTLIYKWERRYLGTVDVFGEHALYSSDIYRFLDTFKPFCGCQITPEESRNILATENADRLDAHSAWCPRRYYPTCECRMDILQSLDEPSDGNNDVISGHVFQCEKKEFRYKTL